MLKLERAARDKFLSAPSSHDAKETLSKVEKVLSMEERMESELHRNFEYTTGRFDRMEAALKHLIHVGPSRAGGDLGNAPGSRPPYVSPSRLVPVNYVEHAGLPPAHQPFAFRGGLKAPPPRYVSGNRPTHAYLGSVAALPLVGAHRAAPRMGGGLPYETTSQLLLQDHARRVFAAYDRDSSGDIDATELRRALIDLGLDANAQQTAAIVAKYDTNMDRRLDFGEFSALVAELREFQSQAGGASSPAQVGLSASLPLHPAGTGGPLSSGGMRTPGAGYYTAEELQSMREAAARQAAAAERARLASSSSRLASLDAGPPP